MAKYAIGERFLFTALNDPREKVFPVTINPIRFSNRAQWDGRDRALDMFGTSLIRLYENGVIFLSHGCGGFEQVEFRVDAIIHGEKGCGEFDSYILNAVTPPHRKEIWPNDGFVFREEILDHAERPVFNRMLLNYDVQVITGLNTREAYDVLRMYGVKIGTRWAITENRLKALISEGKVICNGGNVL